MMDEEWLVWLGVISLVVFFVSLATLPWLVSKIPADYFLRSERTPVEWTFGPPFVRVLMLVAKNLLGLVLFIGGVIMLFIPGQGLLTMMMGAVLVDYPGKYRMERRIVSIRAIRSGLNWLRRKRNVPPLELEQR